MLHVIQKTLLRTFALGLIVLLSGGSDSSGQAVLPTARYSLTWIDGGDGVEYVLPWDINQWGEVAGAGPNPDAADQTGPGDLSLLSSAFIYSALTGTINLNEITADWWDLEQPVATTVTGWHAWHAFGINDAGDVMGNAIKDENVRAFILQDAFGTAPRFLLLPTVGSGDHNGRKINNRGVAVGNASDWGLVRYSPTDDDLWPLYTATPEFIPSNGVCDINDNGVIVSGAYRQLEKGGQLNTVEGIRFSRISSGIAPGIAPMICGTRSGSNKGRNRQPNSVIRLPELGETNDVEVLFSSDGNIWGGAINDHGDVSFYAIQDSLYGFLFYDAINPDTLENPYGTNGNGVLPLADMVITEDSDWVDAEYGIRLDGITNRDVTGLGQIIGMATGTPRGFILTPYLPGPTPGISVSPTSGLITSESGGSDSFDVVLNTQPTADVTIGISSDNTNEGTVDKSSLTFTPANWETAQTISVTGVDDNLAEPANPVDGAIEYTIVTAVATSTDDDYNGLDAEDGSVTNLDNDGPTGGSATYSTDDDEEWEPLAIPDNNSSGISSTIGVSDDYQITDMTVTLNISHQRSSDLDVYLVGPNGVVQLFNFTGDNNVADFNGTSTNGSWTLEVYDTRKKKTGDLNSWSMTVDY